MNFKFVMQNLIVGSRHMLTLLCVIQLLFVGEIFSQNAAKSSIGGLSVHNDDNQAVPIRKRWAFLVGIDSYAHLPELHYCKADMQNLGDALKKFGGYQPECVITITFDEKSKPTVSSGVILSELESLLDKVKTNDSILFAFSGHGDVDENGKAWLMAPEAKIDGVKSKRFKRTALSVQEIYRLVQESKARQKLIVLDACHSGGSKGDESIAALSLNDISPGKGVLELLSCDADQVSYENKELKGGVFSHFLAKGIAGDADVEGDKDGLVSADELYKFAHRRTHRFVEEKMNRTQTPKRRSDAVGEIIVSIRSVRKADMKDDVILEKLKALERHERLPAGFTKLAIRWLGSDKKFLPRRDLKKLLELLAREAISKLEFDRLAMPSIESIEQHIPSSLKFNSRKLHAVVIGINRYKNRSDLEYCEADAIALANVLAQCGGEQAEIELLIGNDTKLANLRETTKNAFSNAKAGDLVLIYFAGMSNRGGPEISSKGSVQLQHLSFKDAAATHMKELNKIKWLGSDCVASEKGVSNEGLGAKELMDLINSSKADVLVVSDSAPFDLPIPSLSSENLPKPNSFLDSVEASKRAVLFVTLEHVVDCEFGSQLQLLLTRAFLGDADTGIVKQKPLLRPIREATTKPEGAEKCQN